MFILLGKFVLLDNKLDILFEGIVNGLNVVLVFGVLLVFWGKLFELNWKVEIGVYGDIVCLVLLVVNGFLLSVVNICYLLLLLVIVVLVLIKKNCKMCGLFKELYIVVDVELLYDVFVFGLNGVIVGVNVCEFKLNDE